MSDYRALVFVGLWGGMDPWDTLIPVDDASYAQLQEHRPSLLKQHKGSRAQDNLTPLAPSNADRWPGRAWALAPELPALKALFDDRSLAFVGNVGPLREPVDRRSYQDGSAKLPPHLFSHPDQQLAVEGQSTDGSNTGRGGRLVDFLTRDAPEDLRAFSSVSMDGPALFATGRRTRPFVLDPSRGVVSFSVLDDVAYLGRGDDRDDARRALDDLFRQPAFDPGDIYTGDLAQLRNQSILSQDTYAAALRAADVTLPVQFPDTDLGNQLRAVCEMLLLRDALDVRRQVFFVRQGGYDTHGQQVSRLGALHTELNDAVEAFASCLRALGLWDAVTTASLSEFGRTLIDNGDGTDHAWGTHAFAFGGSVAGGRLYGDFPAPDKSGPSMARDKGRMVPTMSIADYAAPFEAWMGGGAAVRQELTGLVG